MARPTSAPESTLARDEVVLQESLCLLVRRGSTENLVGFDVFLSELAHKHLVESLFVLLKEAAGGRYGHQIV